MVVEIVKKILTMLGRYDEVNLLNTQINNISSPSFTINLTGIDSDRVNAIVNCLNNVKDTLCELYPVVATSGISPSVPITLNTFSLKKGRIIKADGKDVSIDLSYYPQFVDASEIVLEYVPRDLTINSLLPQNIETHLFLYGTAGEYFRSKGMYEMSEYYQKMFDNIINNKKKLKVVPIKNQEWK